MRTFIFIILLCLLSVFAFAQKGTITNKDGKYGIFDENQGVIVAPICDEIISERNWGSRFFILKKGDKYAYTYFKNLDSFGKFGYLTPHWEISEFVFDELKVIATYLVVRYKQNGKYGLFYVKSLSDCGTGMFTSCRIDGIGELYKTEPIYDNPFYYNDDEILHVQLNGKYGFLEFVDKDMKWINYTYKDWFDTIPVLAVIGHASHSDSRRFRIVKKDGKWGLLEVNVEKKELEYLLSCDCEAKITPPPELREKEAIVFICEKNAQGKLVVYDYTEKTTFEMPLPVKDGWEAQVYPVEFDTVLDKTTYKPQKRYLIIALREIKTKKIHEYGEIYIIDKNKNIKATYNDTNALYEYHYSPLGVLISKKTDTEKENIFEFLDLETGENIFALKVNKNTFISTYQDGNKYFYRKALIEKNGTYSYGYNSCKLQVYLVVVSIEDGKKDKIIGYYDFLTKKLYKKKPPKINGGC